MTVSVLIYSMDIKIFQIFLLQLKYSLEHFKSRKTQKLSDYEVVILSVIMLKRSKLKNWSPKYIEMSIYILD